MNNFAAARVKIFLVNRISRNKSIFLFRLNYAKKPEDIFWRVVGLLFF